MTRTYRLLLAVAFIAGLTLGNVLKLIAEPMTGASLAPFSAPTGNAAVTAAGTNLAGATQLTANFNLITSAGVGATGVKLPPNPGSLGCVQVFNADDATDVNVYPPTAGVKIDELSNGSARVAFVNQGRWFCKASATVWVSSRGAEF